MPPHRPTLSKRALELFVVAAVVIVVAVASLFYFANAFADSRDTRRLADIAELQKALQHYYAEHGAFPSTGWVNSGSPSWERLSVELQPYISATPEDPKNDVSGAVERTGDYNYTYYSADAQNGIGGKRNYVIIFRLERPKNNSAPSSGSLSYVDIARLFRFGELRDTEGIVVMSAR